MALVWGSGSWLTSMNIRKSSGKTPASELLNTLLEFENANGYVNCIPEGTSVIEIKTGYKKCKVTLSSAFAACDKTPDVAEKAVRSIVMTLCSLESVDFVELRIDDAEFVSIDLSRMLIEDRAWLLP